MGVWGAADFLSRLSPPWRWLLVPSPLLRAGAAVAGRGCCCSVLLLLLLLLLILLLLPPLPPQLLPGLKPLHCWPRL